MCDMNIGDCCETEICGIIRYHERAGTVTGKSKRAVATRRVRAAELRDCFQERTSFFLNISQAAKVNSDQNTARMPMSDATAPQSRGSSKARRHTSV